MKKFNVTLILLLFMIVSPLGLLLTGCGATPVGKIESVKFYSNKYEEGRAVFELDIDSKTMLTYKVNPSSYKGEIAFGVWGPNASNILTYEMDNMTGEFRIKTLDFQPVEVRVGINKDSEGNFETVLDTCVVRLKTYPNGIYVNKGGDKSEDIYLNALGSSALHIYGDFGDGEMKELSDEDYNFEVTSEDISIIDVKNSTRLQITSLKNKIAEADVTVKLLNYKGEPLGDDYYSVTFHVKVILPSSRSVAMLEGYSDFIKDGDEITIHLSKGSGINTEIVGTNNEYYCLHFGMELFSNSGQSDEVYQGVKEYDITCTCTQDTYTKIDNEQKIFKVRKPGTTNSLSVNIILVTTTTTGKNSNNGVYRMQFTVNFVFDEVAV